MATVFYGGNFYGGGFFGADGGAPPPPEVVKTGTGGIDPEPQRRRRLHLPVKPTGLPPLRGKLPTTVEDRIQDAAAAQADIAGKLAREFIEPPTEAEIIEKYLPIESMSMEQVHAEIGVLLRKQLLNEEDEMLLLMLMAAAV